MGTRGAYGFHKNGIDKITYNHYDSYPTELGRDIQKFILNHTISELEDIFDRIILVNDMEKPTQEQIEICKEYPEFEFYPNQSEDWYSLLRTTQGNLEPYANGLKYMIDSSDFLKDSLFCEWGWIINLDKYILEIYKGFQTCPIYNRYFTPTPTSGGSSEYYNCQIIKEISFDSLEMFDMKIFYDEIRINEEKNYWYKEVLKTVQDAMRKVSYNNYTYVKECDVKKGNDGYHSEILIDILTREKFQPAHIKLLKKSIEETLYKKILSDRFEIIATIRSTTDCTTGWKYGTPVIVSIKPKEKKDD